MTDLATELGKIKPTTKRTQQIAFIFAFLALLVDGADMLLLSFSLNSLKAEFGLSNLQAGVSLWPGWPLADLWAVGPVTI